MKRNFFKLRYEIDGERVPGSKNAEG